MAIQLQTMSFLGLLLAISAGAVAAVAAGGPSPAITSTCTVASTSPRWKTPYDYCVRTLSSDPAAAAAADTRGLAIAAASLTATNVTRTESVLTALIGSLQGCLDIYKGMSGSVAGGLEDLRAGRVAAALEKLYYASGLPTRCLLAFMYAETQSPIDKEITADISLCTLASSIIDVLKSGHSVYKA